MTSHCLEKCLLEQLAHTRMSFYSKQTVLVHILWAYRLCLGHSFGPNISIYSNKINLPDLACNKPQVLCA